MSWMGWRALAPGQRPLTTRQPSEKEQMDKKRTGRGPAMTFVSLVPFGSNVVLVEVVWSVTGKLETNKRPADSQDSILISSLRGPKVGVHLTWYPFRDLRVLGFAFHSQARHSRRPNRVRQPTDQQFVSGCSPRHLAMAQLPSTIGARFHPE